MTHMARVPRLFFLALSCCLIVILSACDLPWSSTSSQAASNHIDNPPDARPTPTPATKPVPPTKTSCPASGTARALVTAPLAAGQNQAVIYAVNQLDSSNHPVTGMIKSYNVKTGSKKVIVQFSDQPISWTQISPDGQWILYGVGRVADPNDYSAATTLQAIRVDGQGRQTLYCNTNGINNPQWSPDQKKIAFQSEHLQVLDLTTGELQAVVFPSSSANGDFIIYNGWLDSQHFYFHEQGYAGGTGDVYILDLAKGANQTLNDLTRIHSSGYITNFVASYDRSQVYATYTGCGQAGCKPPSSIMALPALSGTAQTLWQSTQYSAMDTCPITAHQMLVTIQNVNYNYDKSHNGTWLMNNDGSGMKQITSDANNTARVNVHNCAYPWNIVSRDSSLYVSRDAYNLTFGKLDGSGSPVTFATASGALQADIAGWTLL